MTFDEAMNWCTAHGATWGFAEGSSGRGRRLWLRVEAHSVERPLPSWCLKDCSAVLTGMVERMRARLEQAEAAA
jgi:hypothetical protein